MLPLIHVKHHKSMLTTLVKAPALQTSRIAIDSPVIKTFQLSSMHMSQCQIIYASSPEFLQAYIIHVASPAIFLLLSVECDNIYIVLIQFEFIIYAVAVFVIQHSARDHYM